MRDFDDNDYPLAYLITFRCYGTWLHGNRRGSMDRKHNVYSSPKIPANRSFENSDRQQLKHPVITLNVRQRAVVTKAVRAVCEHRRYVLRCINVRTNHAHTVVTAMCKTGTSAGGFQVLFNESTSQRRGDWHVSEAMGATWQHDLSVEGKRCC